MLLAKYAGFNRAENHLPVLIYHDLPALSKFSAPGQKGSELRLQQTPVQSALSHAAASPVGVTRSGNIIQRRALSGRSPVGSGFSTREPETRLRSPLLSETLARRELPAPVSPSAARRFSASVSSFQEAAPSGPAAATGEILFLRPTLPSRESLRAAVTLPESGSSNAASVGLSAKSAERLPPLLLSHRPAAAMEKKGDAGEVRQAVASRRVPALAPIFAGVPVLPMSANQRVRGAAGSSVSKTFAIYSGPPARPRSGGAKSFADSGAPMPSLVQTSAPEAFNSEILLRDIRVNPLGRSLPVEDEIAPAAAFRAPSLDLTLQLPTAPAASEAGASTVASAPRPSVTGAEQAAPRSMNSEIRPAVQPPVLSVPEVADRVYRLLERRLVVERERRGVFRS